MQHITQFSLLRIIVCIILGLAMWVVGLLHPDNIVVQVTTAGLVVVNALLFSYILCKMGASNLPSSFAVCSYWVAFSAMPMLHTYWVGQLWIMGMMCVLLLLANMKYHHEPVEEIFVISLLSGSLSLLTPISGLGIILAWVYMLWHQVLSIRLLLASVIGVSVVALYGYLSVRVGWMDISWEHMMESVNSNTWWLLGLSVALYVAVYLPLRKSSVAAGLNYILFSLAVIGLGVCSYFM